MTQALPANKPRIDAKAAFGPERLVKAGILPAVGTINDAKGLRDR